MSTNETGGCTAAPESGGKNKRRKINGDEGPSNAGEETTQRSALTALINHLNYDCLARIFKYLSLEQRLEIETVCKHWKQASQFAWDDVRDLTMHNVQESLSLKDIKVRGRILMRCGVFLKKLVLSKTWTRAILPVVWQHCLNVRELSLHSQSYDENWFESLLNMERLEILSVKSSEEYFPQKFFDFLPITLVQIRICLSSATGNPFSASDAFKQLQNLRQLYLDSVPLDASMINAISQKSGLTNLTLLSCHIHGDLTPLARLENLEFLKLLRLSPEINDNFVIELGNSAKKLKSLDLDSSLETADITDRGIRSLQGLTHLEALSLSYMRHITDDPFGRMYQLRTLVLFQCENIRDNGIIRFIKNAAKLEKFGFCGSNISERVIIAALEVTRARTSLPLLMLVPRYLTNQRDRTADKAYSPLLTIN